MIADIAKQILESKLIEGGLPWHDRDADTSGITHIAQICIDDIDDRLIDDTDKISFPVVLFQEGASEPVQRNNPEQSNVSPQYTTPLQIWVFDKSKDQAFSLAYAVQSIVFAGFAEMRLKYNETNIDAVMRGRKQPASGDLFGEKTCWSALRSLIITNRIEP